MMDARIVTWKLKGLPAFSRTDLEKEIANGAVFVFYNYCIFVVRPSIRYSHFYFIPSGSGGKWRGLTYILLSIFTLGFLSFIPFLMACKVNLKGGVDVTEDVMANLDEQSLSDGIIHIRTIQSLYTKPSKSDLKELRKIIHELYPGASGTLLITAGLYLNTDPNNGQYHIGIRTNGDFKEMAEMFEKTRKRFFYEYVRFHYLDLSLENEQNSFLLKQGTVIFDHTQTIL